MRAALVAVLISAAVPLPAMQEGKTTSHKEARKGDTIVVKGCLDGGALQAVEMEAPDETPLLVQALTFRVTGEKKLVRELKDEHDKRVVSITGVLRSDLPREEGQSASLGRMRIRIGGASPDIHSPASETRRSLPVLEVKSYKGEGMDCGRP